MVFMTWALRLSIGVFHQKTEELLDFTIKIIMCVRKKYPIESGSFIISSLFGMSTGEKPLPPEVLAAVIR